MKRLLSAAALAALPSLAHAGMGFTWYAGSERSAKYGYVSPFGLPSLDIHTEGWTVQLHALELIEGVVSGSDLVLLGGNVHKTVKKMKVSENLAGVYQPGGSLDIVTNFDFDPVYLSAMGLARMGAQTAQGMGFGIYVVPGLGVAMLDGEFDIVVGGSLQISTWMNK